DRRGAEEWPPERCADGGPEPHRPRARRRRYPPDGLAEPHSIRRAGRQRRCCSSSDRRAGTEHQSDAAARRTRLVHRQHRMQVRRLKHQGNGRGDRRTCRVPARPGQSSQYPPDRLPPLLRPALHRRHRVAGGEDRPRRRRRTDRRLFDLCRWRVRAGRADRPRALVQRRVPTLPAGCRKAAGHLPRASGRARRDVPRLHWPAGDRGPQGPLRRDRPVSFNFVPQIVAPDAPFSDAQRAWLNRFFAEALLRDMPAAAPAPREDESTPWHDPAMALDERMALAAARPVRWKLMAAMAQQDCGQCGSSCADYSQAIFEQAEDRLNLCAPGGKATARMLKRLVEEMGGGVIDPEEVAAKAAAAPKAHADARAGYSRERPVRARFVSSTRLNGAGSEKQTHHIEIDLSGSGLDYTVGDSLGVFAMNDPALADAVIAAIDVPPDFPIAGEPF